MDLNPAQFSDYNVGDVSFKGSAADYGRARKGREIPNSTEATRKSAIMDTDHQFRGTTDRKREYAGPIEAGISLRHHFISHMEPGNN